MAKIYDLKKFNPDEFLNKLAFGTLKEEDYKKMSNEELLDIMKRSPEFANFVFPDTWYDKYKLPNKECMNMKEFLKESPWMKKNYRWYEGKTIDIPAKPGGVRPILDVEPVKMEVLTGVNMFSDAPAPIEWDSYQPDTKGQSASLHPQGSEQTLEDSKESSETKTLRL